MTPARPLPCIDLGVRPYAEVEALQEATRARILAGEADAERLFFVEHPPVITLGRRAKPEHILVAPEELERRGVTIARSARGGDVTFHGPGQLVAYPVVRLDRGVVAHVEAMAEAVIAIAADLGVRARFRRDCPGVWVGDAKLAAFGIHVHRRVAIHGVALNVTLDPRAFEVIVPCGLACTPITSLAAHANKTPGVFDLTRRFAAVFAQAIGREASWGAPPPSVTGVFLPLH